jgi:hypothetical protein
VDPNYSIVQPVELGGVPRPRLLLTVHYGLTFLFPAQLTYTAWYGWLAYFVTILASSAIQPPMYIGFSLLAASAGSSCFPRSQQTAHIDQLAQVVGVVIG